MDHARTSYSNKVCFRTEAGAEGMAGKKDHLSPSTSCGIQGPAAAVELRWGDTGNGSI